MPRLTPNGIRKDSVVQRYVRNQRYKLYYDNRFYDVPADVRERKNLALKQIDAAGKRTRAKLRSVLEDLYAQESEYNYTRPKTLKKKSRRRKKKTDH